VDKWYPGIRTRRRRCQ